MSNASECVKQKHQLRPLCSMCTLVCVSAFLSCFWISFVSRFPGRFLKFFIYFQVLFLSFTFVLHFCPSYFFHVLICFFLIVFPFISFSLFVSLFLFVQFLWSLQYPVSNHAWTRLLSERPVYMLELNRNSGNLRDFRYSCIVVAAWETWLIQTVPTAQRMITAFNLVHALW